MKPMISVKVDLRKLDLLEPRIKKAVERGLEKVGAAIERDAKILAPKDTTNLARSINWKRRRFSVRIQENVFYGIFQELGTRFMKAQPFLRPALFKNMNKIKVIIANEVKKVTR